MYSVLIVDDEAIEREYLKRIFLNHPNKYNLVGEACNGIEAMSISAAKQPDIILMDINMPVCNGLIAAKTIKKILDNAIIILNTAYSEFEYAKQAIDYNLDSYLLKPASEEDILNTIHNCISQKSIMNEIPLKTTFLLNTDYPFLIIDKLNNSILNQDIAVLHSNIVYYLDFIKSKVEDLDEYKLNIINTIFSVLLSLKKVIPQNLFMLFDSEQYTYKIITSKQLNTVVNIIEDLFKKILCVLDTNEPYKINISDLIKKYIEESYKDEINLEILSYKFHYSPSYLSRIFHQEQGITINNYINNVRITNSLSLIKYTDLSIKEIALSCGFINISHYNRVFKKITGKTPMGLREGGEY